MIIALPLTEKDAFSAHYGEARKAGFYEVDASSGTILRSCIAAPPDSAPCSWADWLAGMGVELLLVSGMGPGAQRRMEAAGVRVHAGVAPGDPQELLRLWLDGGLPAAPNRCGHDGTAHHAHDHAETGGPHARGGCGCAH